MKNLVFAALASLALVAGARDIREYKPGPDGVVRNPDGSLVPIPPADFKKLPPEVQKAHGRARRLAKVGPNVEKPNAATGYFKYVRCTDAITDGDLKPVLDTISYATPIRQEVVKGTLQDVAGAKDALKALDANAGIFVVASEKLPRIMLAPEDGWAVVNVTALSADKPDRETLVRRVNVELVRAFTYICGSTSDGRSVLMQPVASLEHLDQILLPVFIPFNFANTEKSLANFGIRPRVITTYKQACQDGWANPPTNDIERAIWDKVHNEKENGPANALKITPPRK